MLKELCAIKRTYKRLELSLREVEAIGYSIVIPETDELHLEDPEIIRQGGK